MMKSSRNKKKRLITPLRVGLTLTIITLAVIILYSSSDLISDRSLTSRGTSTNAVLLPRGTSDATIETLDGGSFRLSDYNGKVVVLDLWATWCPPCREEIPYLIELNNIYRLQGVEMVGLTVEDKNREEDAVRDFARRYGINYRIGWASEEFATAMMQGVNSIPQTFVIGRDGKVVSHMVGFSSPSRDNLRQAIEFAVKTSTTN
ncbi:MAG: TlpA disulfide reductase family protein [Pyrinomonadaceae bacterium]